MTHSYATRGSEKATRSGRAEARGSISKEPKRKDIWDGDQRFPWTPATINYMYQNPEIDQASGIKLYECKGGRNEASTILCPRKTDLKKYQKEHPGWVSYASIDHKRAYRKYIEKKAVVNRDGEITTEAACAAYNDVNNLELLSQSANSSKGDR
jgi:hypothetical protein